MFHGGMHVNTIADQRWKESGLFLWWVHFFAGFFSTEAWRVCVFLQAWGLFGAFLAWARPEALRRPKKPQKGRRPVEKHKLWKLKLKKEAKKWTNHKCRLSFHLRVAILLTCIPPWIHFFTLYGQVWVDLTISYYLSIELARKKYPLG